MMLTKKPITVEGVRVKRIDWIPAGDQIGMILGFENNEFPEWLGAALVNDTIAGANVHSHDDGSVHGQVALRMYNAAGEPGGVVEVYLGDMIVQGPDGEIYKVPSDKIAHTYEGFDDENR